MTKILIEEAIPGMVLTEDVFLKDTSVLVMNKGAILDERKIEKLKELEIWFCKITYFLICKASVEQYAPF